MFSSAGRERGLAARARSKSARASSGCGRDAGHAPRHPSRLVLGLGPQARRAVALRPGDVAGLLPGPGPDQVERGPRGAQFEGASSGPGRRPADSPRPSRARARLTYASAVIGPQPDGLVEVGPRQPVLAPAELRQPAPEVPPVEGGIQGDAGAVTGGRLGGLPQVVVAVPQPVPHPDVLRVLEGGLLPTAGSASRKRPRAV